MAQGPNSDDGESGVVRTTSAERRHHMSAVVLKRKLRNFPAANLAIRVVGS
jgi:hypothetical protein